MSSVVAAVKADLALYAKRLPGVDESTLAASALALASRMDDPDTTPTAVSNCARSLAETMDRLVALLPPELEGDELDDLTARRVARRAG